jgi:hypothetical protein
VAAALDVEADAQVLAGVVPLPLVARLDQHRRRVGRLVIDALDPPAQLARRPQRVDHLEVVVWQQGRRQCTDDVEDPPLDARDLRACSLLCHRDHLNID